MIGKRIDGVIYTPTKEERKKVIITNPSEEILVLTRGYKYMYCDEKPEYDAETQYLEENIGETDEAIYVHYIVKDINEVTQDAD